MSMYKNDTITLYLDGFASVSGTDSAFAIPVNPKP
jgi:hypothetical protein